ncbi:MAG: hypothetical protein QW063_00180 [Candidatus Nanoarchaeia archaeon]
MLTLNQIAISIIIMAGLSGGTLLYFYTYEEIDSIRAKLKLKLPKWLVIMVVGVLGAIHAVTIETQYTESLSLILFAFVILLGLFGIAEKDKKATLKRIITAIIIFLVTFALVYWLKNTLL